MHKIKLQIIHKQEPTHAHNQIINYTQTRTNICRK